MRPVKLICLILWFLLGIVGNAQAQTLPAGDEAGRIETRFERVPKARAKPIQITGLEGAMPPAKAAKVQLKIDSIRLSGNTIFSESELQDFFDAVEGKRVSVADVFNAAAEITSEYGKRGYLLSRVIVPPQKLDPSGANITLQAVEGYVDDVRWPEQLDRYRDFFTEYGEKIKSSRPLHAHDLERYLLLAGDLPGLTFRSNLKASKQTPNASTLILTVEEKRFEGSISIDNYGTEGSGPYQATIPVAANNVLGFHERWSGGYITAGPSGSSLKPELSYLFFGYDQTLNSEGLKFSLSGNASWGEPDTPVLSPLGFETSGFNWSADLYYPIIRTRSENLSGTIGFDYKDSDSENIGGIASEDRLRILRANLSYDRADKFNGVNQIVLSLSKGINGLGSTKNDNPNASRNPGQVDFFKTTLSLSRTQTLKNGFSLYGGLFGQLTSDPLLSSQECGYGGRQFGRGFDASIITGERCFLASSEIRYNAKLTEKTQELLDYSQLYGFVDYGKVWNIDAPLGTASQDNGASAGVGIRFGKGKYSADLSVSRIIEEPESGFDPSDWRGWFSVSARF